MVEAVTCQWIEKVKEEETEFVMPANPKKNKKNKKQKKLDWEQKYATTVEEAPI